MDKEMSAAEFIKAVSQGKVKWGEESKEIGNLLGISEDPSEVNESEMEKGKPE